MSDIRLFDQSTYSSRTISTFRIVGAYFVDIYYNHLYQEAIKFKNEGKIGSITEGYKHATFAFLSALDNKSKATYRADSYNKLLMGINEYFMVWTSFTSITLGECLDKIVQEFVPIDYYPSLDKDQKRNILRTVLINIVREFTKIVITEWLSAIIDNHEEMANIDALKEQIVGLFIIEREKMFHMFLDSQTGKQSEKVDKKYAEKMRVEIMKLTDEKTKLVEALKSSRQDLETRTEQLSKVLTKYRKLESSYKQIVAEYRISKEKIQSLEIVAEESAEEIASLNAARIARIPQPISSAFDEDDENEEDEDNEKPEPEPEPEPDTMNNLLTKHTLPSSIIDVATKVELPEPKISSKPSTSSTSSTSSKPVKLVKPVKPVKPAPTPSKQPVKPTPTPASSTSSTPALSTTTKQPVKPVPKSSVQPISAPAKTSLVQQVQPVKTVQPQPQPKQEQKIVNKEENEEDEEDEEDDEEDEEEDDEEEEKTTQIEIKPETKERTTGVVSPISFDKKTTISQKFDVEKSILGDAPKLSDIY